MKKIGIITYHWATNYGAVLQCYALQEALKELGYEVQIINYKPTKFDNNLWHFILYRKFLRISEYLKDRKKEQKLSKFRNTHLILTKRYTSVSQLQTEHMDYDILITGSDQILNPWFLEYGENGGSSAYYLDFGGNDIKRIAYAASFGITHYPERLITKCTNFINKFDLLSSREISGIEIFSTMGRKDATIRPDPTLLHTSDFYSCLLTGQTSLTYCIRMYMLRGLEKELPKKVHNEVKEVITDQSIEEWLNAIRCSSHLITNSFHGLVFCLLFHVPFSIVLNTLENKGMNDRFFTLLKAIGLENRIFLSSQFSTKDINFQFNWNQVDLKLNGIRNQGWSFLKQIYTC